MKAHRLTLERSPGKEGLCGLGHSRLQGTSVESSGLLQPTLLLVVNLPTHKDCIWE